MTNIKHATLVAGRATPKNDNAPDRANGGGAEKQTHNDQDSPTGQRPGKAFATLQAEFALLGLVFRAMSDCDGVEYMAFTWATVHRFATLAQARDYLLTLQAEVAV